MAIRIYTRFDEALEDIVWGGKGQRENFRIRHYDKMRDIREEEVKNFFDVKFASWIDKEFLAMKARGGKDSDYVKAISEILLHLIQNAEYASGRGKGITAELYVGRKGCLAGTRQEAEFFEDYEIESLTGKKPKPLITAKAEVDDPYVTKIGRGTALFLQQDGLLILNERRPVIQRAIYVAKYYPH